MNDQSNSRPNLEGKSKVPLHSKKSYASSRSYSSSATRIRQILIILLSLLTVAVVAILVLSKDGSAKKPNNHLVATTNGKVSRPTINTTTTAPALLQSPTWRVAWGSAMAWGDGVATNTTVRELATVGIGGTSVRIRISNLFGNVPLQVSAASVAQDLQGAQIVPSSLVQLSFNSSPGIVIPVGQVAYSDPVAMQVTAGETLAVSIYVSNSDIVTIHPCCAEAKVSFFTPNNGGNQVSQVNSSAFQFSSPWPRWVDAVDVLQQPGAAPALGSIVVVGDSITEGFNTSIRWTDVLQQRIDMLPPDEQRAVINEGITANTLLALPNNYSKIGGGPAGLDRISQDAIDQSGVSEIILFIGTNDLYFGATASQVIAGYQQAIQLVHQSNLKIIGVTLLPRMAGKEPWTPTQQQYLEQINTWILQPGNFDGTLDFARIIADDYDGSCIPTSMFAPFDSGDNLHPSAPGQVAIADSIVGPEIGMPNLPYVPEDIIVTPTKGCMGTTGIGPPVAMPKGALPK